MKRYVGRKIDFILWHPHYQYSYVNPIDLSPMHLPYGQLNIMTKISHHLWKLKLKSIDSIVSRLRRCRIDKNRFQQWYSYRFRETSIYENIACCNRNFENRKESTFSSKLRSNRLGRIKIYLLCPPLWKRRAYCFAPVGRYVGMSVGRSVCRSVCRSVYR